MLSRIPALFLAALVVSLTACAPAAEEPEPAVEETPTTEANVEAINAVREQEGAAIEAGDIEGFLALTTADVVWMPPNQPLVMGQEALRSWTKAFVDQFGVQIHSYTSDEVVVAGDMAFERYTGSWSLTPVDGGEALSETLKGIHIYQRQEDGSWKIARDIWNSDNPPPGTGQ